MKAGSRCFTLPLNVPKEDERVIASVAAREISVDVAGVAVSSELHGIFTFKEEQRMALKAFLGGKVILLCSRQTSARVHICHTHVCRPSRQLEASNCCYLVHPVVDLMGAILL